MSDFQRTCDEMSTAARELELKLRPWMGKTQFQVHRDALEMCAQLCEEIASRSEHSDAGLCAKAIRERIPSVTTP